MGEVIGMHDVVLNLAVAPLRGANRFRVPTAGSSALRASSPAAILCPAPAGRLSPDGDIAFEDNVTYPLGEPSV